jgi:sulfotransferase
MSSPLSDVFVSALNAMSLSETALFASDGQRARVLTSIIEAYYFEMSGRTVIDTSRAWPAHISALATLVPSSRIICTVRSPAWIIDSVERLVQQNSLRAPKMFAPEAATVYARAEVLMKTGFLGVSLHALRQAWFSEHAGRLIAVKYESLTENPRDTIRKVYDLLGEKQFKHSFDNLEYDEPEFDGRLNMPGLHRVRKRVEPNKRQTILPPDLFSQFDNCFWNEGDQNPRRVPVL